MRLRRNLAGAPAHTWPLGITVPGGTSAPAATTLRLSTCLRHRRHGEGRAGGGATAEQESMPTSAQHCTPLTTTRSQQCSTGGAGRHKQRTFAPSMTVAPMPTTTQSSMVAAWMVAPGPMVTLLPMRVGSAAPAALCRATWITALSCKGAVQGAEGRHVDRLGVLHSSTHWQSERPEAVHNAPAWERSPLALGSLPGGARGKALLRGTTHPAAHVCVAVAATLVNERTSEWCLQPAQPCLPAQTSSRRCSRCSRRLQGRGGQKEVGSGAWDTCATC